MAERKQTPDILAEILSGAPSEPRQPVQPAVKTPPRPKRVATSTRKKITKGRWEYQLASFQYYKGYKLRFIDGEELEDWISAPLIHEYLAQMAQEGWELVAASAGERLYGMNDKHQLFFKRFAE